MNIDLQEKNDIYQMLMDLTCKYNKLEKQIEEIIKSGYKKKINVIEWLSSNVVPNTTFESFINDRNLLVIHNADIEYILDSSFYDTIHPILSRSLFGLDRIPVVAYTNTFYGFEGETWIELSRDNMIKWFNKMHMKFIDAFYLWKKVKILEAGLKKDACETACDKAIVKLMNIDFRSESAFSKMKSMLLCGMKKEM